MMAAGDDVVGVIPVIMVPVEGQLVAGAHFDGVGGGDVAEDVAADVYGREVFSSVHPCTQSACRFEWIGGRDGERDWIGAIGKFAACLIVMGGGMCGEVNVHGRVGVASGVGGAVVCWGADALVEALVYAVDEDTLYL
jgi:hypothetical protein